MRIRTLTPFVLTLAIACGGADTDDAAVTDDAVTAEATQEYAADTGADDADAIAAVEAVAGYWETHYNMGHGSMVASTLADESLFWNGAGTMLFGREAIEAQLNAEIEASSPQMGLDVDETLIFGEMAMMRGTYEVSGTAEGDAFTNTGYWVSYAQNQEGEWKTIGIVGNLDSDGQTTMPGESMELPENGEGAELLQERLEYYMTHFNMGHASMVANTYTEDAITMGSGEALTTGRAAVETRLAEMIAGGAKITELDIWTAGELDDQHVAGAGTYAIEGPDGTVNGHFTALYQRGDDGTLRVRWLLTANHPSAM